MNKRKIISADVMLQVGLISFRNQLSDGELKCRIKGYKNGLFNSYTGMLALQTAYAQASYHLLIMLEEHDPKIHRKYMNDSANKVQLNKLLEVTKAIQKHHKHKCTRH